MQCLNSQNTPECSEESKVQAKRKLVELTAGLEVAPRSYEQKRGCRKQTHEERELRFWSMVSITEKGCWEWKSIKPPKRYGVFYFDDKQQLAHRVSWQLTFGEIPSGLEVLHKCDNGICVRPDHLFLGTQLQNVQDMHRKGRNVRLFGERIGLSKMTTETVKELRSLAETGMYCDRELASRFGIARSVANKIKNRKLWQHL